MRQQIGVIMNINKLVDDINKKTNHTLNTTLNKKIKEIKEKALGERYEEEEISKAVTDITFSCTELIIKKELKRINPSPLKLKFSLDSTSYCNDILNELRTGLPETITVPDVVEIDNKYTSKIDIVFNGYPLKDGGFIGTKSVMNHEDLYKLWRDMVLENLNMKEQDKESQQELVKIKEYICYGFEKALNSEYFMITGDKMISNLENSIEIEIDNRNATKEEVKEFLKSKAI